MGKPIPINRSRRADLAIGSDNEIAERIRERIVAEFGHVTYDLGQIHVWSGECWRVLTRSELAAWIRPFDGASQPNTTKPIQLNKGRIDSIRSILETILDSPGFFSDPPRGVNCASGFITIERGEAVLAPHSPEHRQRHVLPGQWHPRPFLLPAESFLARLLTGCFQGDPDASEKANFLAEAAGAAAIGIATRLAAPKALVLYGPTAENGKSQVLDLFRALLPDAAHVALSPGRIGDERYLIQLAGCLLNASDEMGGRAVFADGFKSVVTGDWVMGRDVYRSALKFRPQALHVLAGNRLPVFEGGMDAGVRRRLAVVTFNRRIPPVGPDSPRIEGIGRLVGEREPDLLLAWAVDGATRLLTRGSFPELASSREALAEWILQTDPVGGWLLEPQEVRITDDDRDVVHSGQAYARFRLWAKREGISDVKVPAKAEFTARVSSCGLKGLDVRRRARGYVFIGLRLARSDQ